MALRGPQDPEPNLRCVGDGHAVLHPRPAHAARSAGALKLPFFLAFVVSLPFPRRNLHFWPLLLASDTASMHARPGSGPRTHEAYPLPCSKAKCTCHMLPLLKLAYARMVILLAGLVHISPSPVPSPPLTADGPTAFCPPSLTRPVRFWSDREISLCCDDPTPTHHMHPWSLVHNQGPRFSRY